MILYSLTSLFSAVTSRMISLSPGKIVYTPLPSIVAVESFGLDSTLNWVTVEATFKVIFSLIKSVSETSFNNTLGSSFLVISVPSNVFK